MRFNSPNSPNSFNLDPTHLSKRVREPKKEEEACNFSRDHSRTVCRHWSSILLNVSWSLVLIWRTHALILQSMETTRNNSAGITIKKNEFIKVSNVASSLTLSHIFSKLISLLPMYRPYVNSYSKALTRLKSSEKKFSKLLQQCNSSVAEFSDLLSCPLYRIPEYTEFLEVRMDWQVLML